MKNLYQPKRYRGAPGFLLLALTLLCPWPREAAAYAPYVLDMKVDLAKIKQAGKAKLDKANTRADTKIRLLLTNTQDSDLLVQFPACTQEPVRHGALVASLGELKRYGVSASIPFDPEPRWRACMSSRSKIPGLFVVRRGRDTTKIKVGIDFLSEGTYRVGLTAQVFVLPDGALDRIRRSPNAGQFAELQRLASPAAEHPIELFYEVTGEGADARYRLLSSETVVLPAEDADGIAAKTMPRSTSADPELPVAIDDYLSDRLLVPDMPYDRYHTDLRLISTDTGPEDGVCECRDPATGADCEPGAAAVSVTSRESLGGSLLLLGSFSVRWTDTLYHPAYGWNVVAWWNDGGTWRKLASSYISSDGSFAIVAHHPDWNGENLRVQFRPSNSLFNIVNQNENLYRWNTKDFFNVSFGSPLDVGDWWIDAAARNVNGIGEAYEDGYQVYREMVYRAKINPQRASPIRVFFPNTWQNCNGPSPWSCANADGDIWLIQMHATDRVTIQHELGHQMNYEFWNNKEPTGCCIPHNVSSCYNRGLALAEGYANFVPIWVQVDRGSLPGSIGIANIENPIAACKTPGKDNESWVAATFWDLHDSRKDGDDTIYFSKQGAVHAIFFNNPVGSDGGAYGMDDLQTVYRNQASGGHETIIDDIFSQNDTD